MGLITKLLTLPVRGPADGVVWIASKIAEQADAERNSPAALRAALADAEAKLLDGRLSEEDYDVIEDDLLARLTQSGHPR